MTRNVFPTVARLVLLRRDRLSYRAGSTRDEVLLEQQDRYSQTVEQSGLRYEVREHFRPITEADTSLWPTNTPRGTHYSDEFGRIALEDIALWIARGTSQLRLTRPVPPRDSLVEIWRGANATITAGLPASVEYIRQTVGDTNSTFVTGDSIQPWNVRVTDLWGSPVPNTEVRWLENSRDDGARSRTDADGRASYPRTWIALPITPATTANPGADEFSSLMSSVTLSPDSIITDGRRVRLLTPAMLDIEATLPTERPVTPGDQWRGMRARALTAGWRPVPSLQVEWSSLLGGAVSAPLRITGSNGLTPEITWTTDTISTVHRLRASSTTRSLFWRSLADTVTVTSPSAVSLTTGLPATTASGARILPSPIVQMRDVFGDPVRAPGLTITARRTTGDGTLAGTTSVTTDSTGAATFSTLTLSGATGTTHRLTFSAPRMGSVVSGDIRLTSGISASLSLATDLPLTTPSGAPIRSAPIVQIRDAEGNAVFSSGVIITARLTSGDGIFTGTTSAATDSIGQATFSNLTLSGRVGTSHVLTFVSADLTSIASRSTTLTTGAAVTLLVSLGDAQSAEVGTAVRFNPLVLVSDAAGNPVPGVRVLFSPSTSGSRVTGGTATTNVSGLASVGSWTMSTLAGTNTLTASSDDLPSVTFTATATAGLPARMMQEEYILDAPPSRFNTIVTGDTIPRVSVRIVDRFDNPVPDVYVEWLTREIVGTDFFTQTDSTGHAESPQWVAAPDFQAEDITSMTAVVRLMGQNFNLLASTLSLPILTPSSIFIDAEAEATFPLNPGDPFDGIVAFAMTDGWFPIPGLVVEWSPLNGGSVNQTSGTTGADGLTPAIIWMTGTTGGRIQEIEARIVSRSPFWPQDVIGIGSHTFP